MALGTTYGRLLSKGGADFKTYKDDPTGIQAVQSGIVGGIVTDVAVGAYAIQKGAPLKAAGPLLFVDPTYVTIAKGNPDLEKALNTALGDLYDNGTLKQIGMKWFGQDMASAQCFNVPLGGN